MMPSETRFGSGWRGPLNATPVLRLEVDPALIGAWSFRSATTSTTPRFRKRLEQLRQRLIEGKSMKFKADEITFSHSE